MRREKQTATAANPRESIGPAAGALRKLSLRRMVVPPCSVWVPRSGRCLGQPTLNTELRRGRPFQGYQQNGPHLLAPSRSYWERGPGMRAGLAARDLG